MRRGPKTFLAAAGAAILTFVLNAVLFILFYNHLTTPYIEEERRVLNADYIMSVVLGSYVGVSLAVGVALYFLIRPRR